MNITCFAIIAGLAAFWAAIFAALVAFFGFWNTFHFTAALAVVFLIAVFTRALADLVITARYERKESSK